MKRLATTSFVLVGLVAGLTSTVAEAAEGVPIVQRSHVAFHMVSPDRATPQDIAVCPKLPSGTTVDGSASELSITTERTDRSGARTIDNTTIANGTATDNKGNRYLVEYANQFRISNTVAEPGVFSGTMTDVFVLAGSGPARLHNGFAADLTTKADLSFVSSWTVRHAFGDPISFKPGPFVAHCDPL